MPEEKKKTRVALVRFPVTTTLLTLIRRNFGLEWRV